MTSSRSISYIYTLGLGKLWEFYLGFRICALINYILVISHIGETYPEDVRGQARLGGDATINLTLKLNPLVTIVVKMQVGIVLDRGLGGLAKTSKLTLKHKNKVKNVRKDSQDSR